MLPMKNWAKSFEFHPEKILAPTSTEEIQTIVKDHLAEKKTIRMRGSAHSWTKVFATSESFMHLDEMQGIMKAQPEKELIHVKAGTKLFRFGEEAFKFNMSLPNQGDINHQSVAGALSTGTHGTGITLQSMANQLYGMTVVTGEGDQLNLNQEKNPELMQALSVSMGSAAVLTEATVKMKKAYKLKVESFAEDFKQSRNELQKRLRENRHLEMFYFPVGQWAMVKIMNETTDVVTPPSRFAKAADLVLENWLYEALNILAHKTNSYKGVDSFMRKFVNYKTFTDWSHRAFPTERTVRFMEMEYNVPLEKFDEVFEEIQSSIEKNQFQTLFPIEIRFVKGDELWLSPAYQRDSVYFAIHTYIDEDYLPYFENLQRIFKRHGGRPHWGKWHSLAHDDFEKVYPKWHEFKKIRHELDPNRLWLNDHLKTLFPRST
jgi:FAD-linked oxidoreductase